MHYSSSLLLSPLLYVFGGMFAFIRCCKHLLYKYCELIKSEMISQHFTFNSTKERIPDAINKYCIGIKQSLLFQWFSIILPGRVHFSWNLFIFSETRRCVTFQIEKLDTLLFIRNWEENIVPSVQTILAHLGVGHGGQRALDARHGGGHRQQSRHPESHPGGNLAHGSVRDNYIYCWYYRFIVQPEGEPGDDHDHEAGDVDGDDVEGELAGEHEVHPEAGVLPGGRGHVAILVGVVGHLEAPGQGEVGSELQRARVFPNIDQVVLSPAIWNKRT